MFFVALLILLIGIWGVLTYNSFIGLRNRARNAWADIEVQLKRRHDLIPNVVETVKGYAKHERTLFENVTKARAQATQGTSPREKAEGENLLTRAIRQLFAVAENYPELKANQNFLSLQKNLNEIEQVIQNARRYYNAVVRDFNIKLQSFPSRLVGRLFGFKEIDFFELEEPSEAELPEVDFT